MFLFKESILDAVTVHHLKQLFDFTVVRVTLYNKLTTLFNMN